MNAEGSVSGHAPPPSLHEACSNLVHHLRKLGYPHADSTTCARMLRAYFPHEPSFADGSPDLAAGTAFLERFLAECRKRETETIQPQRARRCYGAAVEQAVSASDTRGDFGGHAPRLTELMTQLDADGHDTALLRLELSQLVDEIGMRQFYA
jgi:hypothetical protein